jgi:molybdenum cofactor synthesis domain-containing protein
MTTAAGIIIGDEILTGRVRDTNAPLLIDLLNELGVTLCSVSIIGDDLDGIAEQVRRDAERHDAVITSGGVGPTHDDLTIEGVARAFAVPVVRHPELEQLIRRLWGERFTEGALRMADVPEGARLLFGHDGLLPLVAFRNIYLLPGIPQLFAAKLKALRDELHGCRPTLHNLYLTSDESRIAPCLAQVDGEFEDVKIGSYPTFGQADYRLWVTIEGMDPERVERARRRLLEIIPTAEVIRSE